MSSPRRGGHHRHGAIAKRSRSLLLFFLPTVVLALLTVRRLLLSALPPACHRVWQTARARDSPAGFPYAVVRAIPRCATDLNLTHSQPSITTKAKHSHESSANSKMSRSFMSVFLLALFALMFVQNEAATCPYVCRTNVDIALVESSRRLSSCRVYTCSTGGRSGTCSCY